MRVLFTYFRGVPHSSLMGPAGPERTTEPFLRMISLPSSSTLNPCRECGSRLVFDPVAGSCQLNHPTDPEGHGGAIQHSDGNGPGPGRQPAGGAGGHRGPSHATPWPHALQRMELRRNAVGPGQLCRIGAQGWHRNGSDREWQTSRTGTKDRYLDTE